jgi:hypothetical protein
LTRFDAHDDLIRDLIQERPSFALTRPACAQRARIDRRHPSSRCARTDAISVGQTKTMVKRIMTTAIPSFTSLTDEQLLARVKTLTEHERQATAALIAALTELDARRLYLREGYPSLFAYCTQALHL